MKYIIAFVFFIGSFHFAHADNLSTLRTLYPASIKSAANAKKLLDASTKMNASDPAVSGYRLAAEIVGAKFSKSLEQKKVILKNGITKLEKLLASNPQNVELRLIRLSVQENMPKIVGYHKNIQEDKNFIIKNYNSQSTVLKQYISSFVVQSKSFSAAEKALLK